MQPNYRPALELAQRDLRAKVPEEVAAYSHARLVSEGAALEFRLRILDREYRIPFPECRVYDLLTGKEAGVSPTLVGLHYLITADGAPTRGEWVPWRAIPGAGVYEAAFRRRSVDIILGTFARDPQGLALASRAIGAEPLSLGDVSFSFNALPRLPMACVLWAGDEEQEAECNLLFDAVAPHYLPTEDLAALGTMVALSLVQGGKKAGE